VVSHCRNRRTLPPGPLVVPSFSSSLSSFAFRGSHGAISYCGPMWWDGRFFNTGSSTLSANPPLPPLLLSILSCIAAETMLTIHARSQIHERGLSFSCNLVATFNAMDFNLSAQAIHCFTAARRGRLPSGTLVQDLRRSPSLPLH